jgi:hypothetical protein
MSRQRRKKGVSELEGFAHIEAYLRSSLRPSEYYRSEGLSEYQFYNWRRKYLSVHPELSGSKSETSDEGKRFHKVKFEHMPSSTPLPGGLEIHYPHGVKVVISTGSGLDLDTLVSLIKLRASCSV